MPSEHARPASASHVEMTELILPPDGNTLGTAFGGKVMQWTDLAASIAAMRHARMPVVTASIDGLNFLAPMRVGEIAIFRAQVNAVFGSSMEVEVNVMAEDPRGGSRRHCCEAFLTFVALGPEGKPARAPALLTESEEERRRAADAADRREQRLRRRPRTPDPRTPEKPT